MTLEFLAGNERPTPSSSFIANTLRCMMPRSKSGGVWGWCVCGERERGEGGEGGGGGEGWRNTTSPDWEKRKIWKRQSRPISCLITDTQKKSKKQINNKKRKEKGNKQSKKSIQEIVQQSRPKKSKKKTRNRAAKKKLNLNIGP